MRLLSKSGGGATREAELVRANKGLRELLPEEVELAWVLKVGQMGKASRAVRAAYVNSVRCPDARACVRQGQEGRLEREMWRKVWSGDGHPALPECCTGFLSWSLASILQGLALRGSWQWRGEGGFVVLRA